MLDPKSTSIRAASGAVYILIIVLACWWGAFGVMLLACLFGALGIYEFRKMNFPDNPGGGGLAIYDVIGGLVLIFTGDILLFPAPLIIWIVWLLGRMVLTVFSKRDHPEREFAIDIMAQIYVSLPLAIMTVAAQFSEEVNSHLNYNSSSHCLPILAVFILIWINDTGALIFGSSFGRHKLYERVSPKKSWEGFW
ncbi:MAG: phosphatidate cytidylyltransferase, partial [Muribaculaceae bacterium]|nr:phosphatidate cytidylyltransferase [Muribaculaceae bacterium]